MLFAVRLFSRLLYKVSIVVEPLKDALRNLRVLLSGGAAKMIEAYLKPLIHFPVDFVVFVAKLRWGNLLLQRLRFCRSAILIRSANIKGLASTGFMVSGCFELC